MNDIEPRLRDVAMVFQNYALYPHMTVFDNIAYPLASQSVNKQGDPRAGERGPGGSSA